MRHVIPTSSSRKQIAVAPIVTTSFPTRKTNAPMPATEPARPAWRRRRKNARYLRRHAVDRERERGGVHVRGWVVVA